MPLVSLIYKIYQTLKFDNGELQPDVTLTKKWELNMKAAWRSENAVFEPIHCHLMSS